MPRKKEVKEPKNARRWTVSELDCFADILSDPENCFANALDKLALKKSYNNEVYEHIQKVFLSEMEKEDFKNNTERRTF